MGSDRACNDTVLAEHVLGTANRKVENFERRAASERSPPTEPGGPAQQPPPPQSTLPHTGERGPPPETSATSQPAGPSKLPRNQSKATNAIGPPQSANVTPDAIHKLYRGTTAKVGGESVRLWVDFPELQLCCARYDQPARAHERSSLLDLSVETRQAGETEVLDVYRHAPDGPGTLDHTARQGLAAAPGAAVGDDGRALVLSAQCDSQALRAFAKAMKDLLACAEEEGKGVLEFIQKRLFQYLWRHALPTTDELVLEAQAVLCFNLEPKQGVAYLRGKLGKGTDAEVGEWLAQKCAQGGLDPTMLGNYFSRRDTLEVFKSFVRCLDFGGMDIVDAMRKLFDSFKPGGEGQVITRILELFAEAYFIQWQSHKDSTLPKTAFANADSVLSVAVSLIMLNTGLHVAPKKNPGKRITGAAMSVEEYVSNTRLIVQEDEVPLEALHIFYEAVRKEEISVEPMPRALVSSLPVQPDIEGWLVAILNGHDQRRYWGVLALQRLYLFSDKDDVASADAIDLKDTMVDSSANNRACRERFMKDLHSSKSACICFSRSGMSAGRGDLVDALPRAFEVSKNSAILENLDSRRRTRISLVAESADLMEKWVNLISSGPS